MFLFSGYTSGQPGRLPEKLLRPDEINPWEIVEPKPVPIKFLLNEKDEIIILTANSIIHYSPAGEILFEYSIPVSRQRRERFRDFVYSPDSRVFYAQKRTGAIQKIDYEGNISGDYNPSNENIIGLQTFGTNCLLGLTGPDRINQKPARIVELKENQGVTKVIWTAADLQSKPCFFRISEKGSIFVAIAPSWSRKADRILKLDTAGNFIKNIKLEAPIECTAFSLFRNDNFIIFGTKDIYQVTENGKFKAIIRNPAWQIESGDSSVKSGKIYFYNHWASRKNRKIEFLVRAEDESPQQQLLFQPVTETALDFFQDFEAMKKKLDLARSYIEAACVPENKVSSLEPSETAENKSQAEVEKKRIENLFRAIEIYQEFLPGELAKTEDTSGTTCECVPCARAKVSRLLHRIAFIKRYYLNSPETAVKDLLLITDYDKFDMVTRFLLADIYLNDLNQTENGVKFLSECLEVFKKRSNRGERLNSLLFFAVWLEYLLRSLQSTEPVTADYKPLVPAFTEFYCFGVNNFFSHYGFSRILDDEEGLKVFSREYRGSFLETMATMRLIVWMQATGKEKKAAALAQNWIEQKSDVFHTEILKLMFSR